MFYGKSEVGRLTHTTLKQTSLFQDKQRKKALNTESHIKQVFCKPTVVPWTNQQLSCSDNPPKSEKIKQKEKKPEKIPRSPPKLKQFSKTKALGKYWKW